MTDVMTTLLETARKLPRRIVMSEGEDPRIVEGALRALREGVAQPSLVGREADVARQIESAGASPDDIEVVDPATSTRASDYAEGYYALRKHKGIDQAAAKQAIANPLVFAAMMVREGDADGTIGGAVATTGETVRNAFQIIGPATGVRSVSSFFLMLLNPDRHPGNGVLAFADCALIVEPEAEELAQIAISTAGSFNALTGLEPRIAMLSFSTLGSARHDRVSRVAAATSLVRDARADLIVDGEIQFDAAFVASVADRKAPGSPLNGAGNVFVFPGLESANIGYKIAQRIGNAKAIGPILQGLAKPANDLSRGCSADDVYDLIAITSIQASHEV